MNASGSRIILALAVLIECAPSVFANPLPAVDYAGAYKSALRATEAIPSQEAQAERAAEQVTRAKGGFLPTIAGSASYLRQDVPASTTVGSTGSLVLPNQSAVKLSATEPLFRGTREYSGLDLVKAQERAQREVLEQSKLDLHSAVSNAFYSVIEAERDLAELNSLLTLSEKRVGDLKGRVRIGRSRPTELLTAQTQAAAARAQVSVAQQTLVQARATLALATGLPRDARLIDSVVLPPRVPPVESYLAKMDAQPGLRSRGELVEAAVANEHVAVGGHYPAVDLGANYYLSRTGALANSKWDAQVALTVPIYQGGVVQSLVRDAALQLKQAELDREATRRQLERQLRNLHEQANSSIEQLALLRQASELADRNYHSLTSEYGLGLVTNLDVLQALNSFIEARRTEARTFFTAKAAWIALNAAVGQTQEFER